MSGLAISEDDLLIAVTDLCHLYRWRYYHIRNSKRGIVQGDPGFPDLVLLKPPRLLFVELKSDTGRLSPPQHEWLELLDRVPTIEHYVWTPTDHRNGSIAAQLAPKAT